jgi:hypothetical protein
MRISGSTRRNSCAAALVTVAIGAALAVGDVPTQQAKLTADDGADGDNFGGSVALVGDTALVGAFGKNASRGTAGVLTRTGTTWTPQTDLAPADPADGDRFGTAVAFRGDTAVVSAVGKNTFRGAAYVFTRTGTAWTQQAELTADDGAAHDNLATVALSGDTVVAGANGVNVSRGAAYVFTRTGTTWTQQAKLTAADETQGSFLGASVAIDVDTAVVGAIGKDSLKGAAYVFTRAGTTWTQQTRLATTDAAVINDNFGSSAAVAGDTAIVGAVGKESFRGAAYVFTRTGTVWTQTAKLTASSPADGDRFGASIALDGDTAVVGASNRNSRGAIFVFQRTGTTWTQTAEVAAQDAAAGDLVGGSVATSGGTILAGAYPSDSSRGAAYVFAVAPPGYCLATKVKARANAAHPEKSTLVASGLLDTGTVAQDFSGPATFFAGRFRLDVPAFVAKGRSLTYAAGGIKLKITPAKNGSSRAAFSVKAVGDLAGKLALDGPLRFDFTDAAHSLTGTVGLTAGALGLHGVTAPRLGILSAAATVRGGGRDSLKLRLSFVPDGALPAAPEDLTIGFGGTYRFLLPAAFFARRGFADVLVAKSGGITKANVDHRKGTITVAGAGLDLGAFATGANAVVVTITRGADTRSVPIRMALAGTKLSY